MEEFIDETLIDEKSFSCMTSDEAIRIFLSRNPVKLSITDISQNLGYHRNTTKKAIKRMPEIRSIGSGNYTNYFIKSMTDHYREVGEAIKVAYDANPLSDDRPFLDYLRAFGYALVKSNLEEMITEEYTENYDHEKVTDNLIHLKMSYPFEDIIEVVQEDGSTNIESSVKFYLQDDNDSEAKLRVHQCLCRGKEKLSYLCEMVAGALQAGLNFACQMYSSKIKHIECHDDGSCVFQISSMKTTEEDVTALDELM